jgi:hypothetical protein
MEVRLSFHDVLPLVTKFLRSECGLSKLAKKIEKKDPDAPYDSVTLAITSLLA